MKDAIVFILIFIHTIISINLLGRVFGKTKHYTLWLIVIASINASLGCYAYSVLGAFSWESYLISMLVFLGEMAILFRVYPLGILTGITGVYLHAFAIRSIILSITAITQGVSMNHILNDPDSFFIFTVTSLSVHIVVLLIFTYSIPPKYLSAIVENINLIGFLAIITVLLSLYAVINSLIFNINTDIPLLNMQQILLPLFLLIMFYAALFATIRIIIFQKYKSINAELENKIDKDKSLQLALFNLADIFMEINCTRDIVTRFIINKKEQPIENLPPYSQYYLANSAQYVYHEDIPIVSEYTPAKIVEYFNNGVTQLTYDYRTTYQSNDQPGKRVYLWHRMNVVSSMNEITGDITAICTADEIQAEKEQEIALRIKAEHDPLTGAYNKEGARKHISEHLKNNGVGTVFMFDLDNFKGINDNMGHAYGDKVLCELHEAMKSLFRSKDIIARLGGDEFVIFMVGDENLDLVKSKADSICKKLNKVYVADNGVKIEISTSIGVSIAPKDAQEYGKLLHLSDLAMYASKNSGKNTFTIYDKEIHNKYQPQEIEAYQRKGNQA